MDGSYEEQDFADTTDQVHRRQRFLRRPKSTADLLGQLMARKGYAQQETKSELDDAWDQVIDPQLRTRTRVGTIRNGSLEVIVDSAVVHQQLEFQKQTLLNQLRDRLQNPQLKQIRFRVGSVR